VLSVPLWGWRVAMVAWFGWLAVSLVAWGKWGYQVLTEGGLWRREPAVPGEPTVGPET
jgi:hypothetical protein